jgi:hypothetical protein
MENMMANPQAGPKGAADTTTSGTATGAGADAYPNAQTLNNPSIPNFTTAIAV